MSGQKTKLIERGLCGFNVANRKNILDFLYMFVSQHQPLQIADNKRLVFVFQGNYYFASNMTPVLRDIYHVVT